MFMESMLSRFSSELCTSHSLVITQMHVQGCSLITMRFAAVPSPPEVEFATLFDSTLEIHQIHT